MWETFIILFKHFITPHFLFFCKSHIRRRYSMRLCFRTYTSLYPDIISFVSKHFKAFPPLYPSLSLTRPSQFLHLPRFATKWPLRQYGGLVLPKSRDRSRIIHALLICSGNFHVQVALRGYCPVKRGDNDQSIGSTVSGPIVRSWLWSTANDSWTLGYFGIITACSCWLTPRTLVVDSLLGSSWP